MPEDIAGAAVHAAVGPTDLLVQDVTGWSEYHKQQGREALTKIAVEAAAGGVPPPTGWTPDAWVQALLKLAAYQAVQQVMVIQYAMEHGGRITRSEVYKVTGRDEGKVLKGFTRPTNRATDALVEQGLLPTGVKPLLTTLFEDPTQSGIASGFEIPVELVVT